MAVTVSVATISLMHCDVTQAGLQSSTSLEELDLTACSLTDRGVSCVADVIKVSSSQAPAYYHHYHIFLITYRAWYLYVSRIHILQYRSCMKLLLTKQSSNICLFLFVVQSHAQRRSVASFQAGLRQYPDPSLPPAMAHVIHYAAMRQAAQQVGGAHVFNACILEWLYMSLRHTPIVDPDNATCDLFEHCVLVMIAMC